MQNKETEIETKPQEIITSQKVSRISKVSIWLGVLAVIPYVCMASSWWEGLVFGVMPSFSSDPIRYLLSYLAVIILFIGFFVGFPVGLAGIITGSIALFKKPNKKRDSVFAIAGIFLSIGGFIGHYWFLNSCLWCQ